MSFACDLLIINGTILTEPGLKAPLPDGYVAIQSDTITAVGAMAELPPQTSARQTIDARGDLVMPGLVNGHCHAAMTLFRGLADDLPLMDWLQKHIFPAEARFVSKEMAYWCSKLAAAEMILSGTTTVADSYFLEEAAAKAFHDSGMRAIVAQGIIDFPAPGVPDPAKNIEAAEAFIKTCQEQGRKRITPAIFCHSPYTCSAKTLRFAKTLAAEQTCKFFIHLAETHHEVKQIHEQHGMSPVQYLHNLHLLDHNTVAVHCVHLSDEDISILKHSATAVITCPESNMKLASGIAPIPKMLAAGISLGLGSDGCASNNDLDLFGEMDSLAKLHKVANLDPTVMPASQALRLATSGGAEALGLGESTGRLAPGLKADCIILNLDAPHLTPFHHHDLLVYGAKGSDVRTSIIDGVVVMHERQILAFDQAETMAHVRKLATALHSR
ncbi:MAG: amidohydrolase [Desulfobulbaceae bacterium]|nr:amidohydrolase [Desulfobulbaceae bacterium]